VTEAMQLLLKNGIRARQDRTSLALSRLSARPAISDYLHGNYPRDPGPSRSRSRWTIYKVRTQTPGPVLAICELSPLSIEVDPLRTATLFACEDHARMLLDGSVRRANEFDIRVWRACGRPDVVAALDVPNPDAR